MLNNGNGCSGVICNKNRFAGVGGNVNLALEVPSRQ